MDYDDYEDREPTSKQIDSPDMKLEVRISEYDMNSIARNVAEQMAERVLRNKGEEIKRMADELVTKRALEYLDAAIAPVVADAMSRPLVPTDAFGRPKGDPVSISDFMARGAQAYLETCLDPNGKPTSDNFWNGKQYQRISRFVAQVIDSKFDAEMQKSVNAIKAEVRQQMAAAASEWLRQFQVKTIETLAKN